jgi:cupin superfamily acireductone dioxygenase involved in methionine salvage
MKKLPSESYGYQPQDVVVITTLDNMAATVIRQHESYENLYFVDGSDGKVHIVNTGEMRMK